MTRHNLKYKRTIHKCLPVEEKKKISAKRTREPICGKLQKVNYVAGSREKQKVDAPPVKGKAPMMRLNGKSQPHSPPPPVSQFVSHSISPRTRIPRTTNSFGGRKKKKSTKAQENETNGSRRATFDSWKPLKLYACCELSGLPPSSQLLMLIFCWPRLEQLTWTEVTYFVAFPPPSVNPNSP